MDKEEKVVNLFAAKKEEPHLSGEMFCLGCGHKWVGCCPIGTIDFECPSCHSMKGRMKYEVMRIGESHYTCNCGNQYFSITPTCIYCPNCGLRQQPYD